MVGREERRGCLNVVIDFSCSELCSYVVALRYAAITLPNFTIESRHENNTKIIFDHKQSDCAATIFRLLVPLKHDVAMTPAARVLLHFTLEA